MQDFRTRRNFELNDRDVGVFLPRLNSFVENRRNGFTGYRQCICAKGHAIPKNKSCLYCVNINTVFHNEQFVKCPLSTANIVLVSVEQSLIGI